MKKSMVVGVAAMMVSLSACDLSNSDDAMRFAFVDIEVTPELDQQRVEPSAIFFTAARTAGPDSRTMEQGCALVPNPVEGGNPPIFNHINGGDSVIVVVGLNQVALYPFTSGVLTEYSLSPGTPLFGQAANEINVLTVGAAGGFPEMSLSTAVVTPPEMNAATIPSNETADMAVTWANATNDVANKIELSIGYVPVDGDPLRVLCVFNDSGNATIPWQFLSGPRTAAGSLAGTATRFRANTELSGDNALIAVVRAQGSWTVSKPPASVQ